MNDEKEPYVLEPGRYGMYIEGVLFKEGKYTRSEVESRLAEARG